MGCLIVKKRTKLAVNLWPKVRDQLLDLTPPIMGEIMRRPTPQLVNFHCNHAKLCSMVKMSYKKLYSTVEPGHAPKSSKKGKRRGRKGQ